LKTVTINITHTEINPKILILYWNLTINETRNYSNNYTNFTLTNLNDGTYTYYVWVNDSANNENQTETRTVRIDTIPPQISIITPTNDSWTNETTVLFTYNVTDEILTVANCSLIIDNKINQTNKTITEDASLNFTAYNLTDGTYNWNINCTEHRHPRKRKQLRNKNNKHRHRIPADKRRRNKQYKCQYYSIYMFKCDCN
jgi:hypothetical protein